jgi:transposase
MKSSRPPAASHVHEVDLDEVGLKSLKTVDLEVRPIFHWSEARVRAHVFICVLALYVERHAGW